jgi:hypothetical protein
VLICSPSPSAEYELNGYGLTGLYGLHDHDIPCSVCSVASPTVVMSECWELLLCFWGGLSNIPVLSYTDSSWPHQLPCVVQQAVQRLDHVSGWARSFP